MSALGLPLLSGLAAGCEPWALAAPRAPFTSAEPLAARRSCGGVASFDRSCPHGELRKVLNCAAEETALVAASLRFTLMTLTLSIAALPVLA